MSVLEANVARFAFESTGYDGELQVTAFSGHEGISELFTFGIELAAEDPAIDMDGIIGQPACFTMVYPEGERAIYGIVPRVEQSVAGESFTPYFAQLVPTAWKLTQRYQSRIFQNRSVPEIIEETLEYTGVDSDHRRFALQGTYQPRDYCVQYRETNWNFIARLMEEEGIFFFFEHEDGRDVIVVADSPHVHVPIEGDSDVVFRDPSGAVPGEEYIHNFRYAQQLRLGVVMLNDFNAETPRTSLVQEAHVGSGSGLWAYDYPGLYQTADDGRRLARLRLDAAQTRRCVGQGHSICRRLVPGSTFTLQDFPRPDFNREYLLIWVQHEGTQPLGMDDAGGRFSYNNTFRCIPASVPFRPVRKTPKPVVEGSQTAIVTGPDGEEVYVDSLGRIKVKFHWDLDSWEPGGESCWIRVSQLWAGQGWGAMFIPRIGQEVIVDFLEGDPDRPIITGRVYNGVNPVPYPLDAEKTKSTIMSNSTKGGGGANEIRFEDKKDDEEIYIHAQKDQNQVIRNDLSISVGHDMTTTVGHDQNLTVKKNRTVTIEEEDHTFTVSDGKQSVTINKDAELTVQKGNRTVNVVEGKYILSAKKSVTLHGESKGVGITGDAKGVTIKGTGKGVAISGNPNLSAEGTSTVAIKSPDIDIGDTIIKIHGSKIELIAGGGSITIDGSGVSIKGNKITSSATGSHDISGTPVNVSGSQVNLNC